MAFEVFDDSYIRRGPADVSSVDENSEDYLRMLSMHSSPEPILGASEEPSNPTALPQEKQTSIVPEAVPIGVKETVTISAEANNAAVTNHLPSGTATEAISSYTASNVAEINTTLTSPVKGILLNSEVSFVASFMLTVKGSRLRNKFKFKPLPVVDCIEFKGLAGKMKRNVAMMQIFATLFKIIQHSYHNREAIILPLHFYNYFYY